MACKIIIFLQANQVFNLLYYNKLLIFYFFLEEGIRIPAIVCNTDNTIEKNNALKNPFTTKPLTKYSANNTIIALITKVNKANVSIVIGNEKICKIGFTIAFKTDNATTTHKADDQLSIETPGTITSVNITKILETINRIIKFIVI